MVAPRALFLVNYDWFFVSHRLALGQALKNEGFDVAVAALATGAEAKIREAGLRFVPMPFRPGGRNPAEEASTVAAIAALYRRERPDLVHHVTIKPVLYGSLVARALRVPAAVNAVSGLGYVFIERPGDGVRHRALREAIKATYRVSLSSPRSRTIFQNPDDRYTFESAGLIKRHQTVMVKGSGVDLTRFQAEPLPEGPPLVVLPARMLKDKGVIEFVEAAKIVRRRLPEARFALVGGVDQQNPTGIPEAQLQQWHASGEVEWWGHQSDMPQVFAKASLVVLPSYREGLPLALAEAAATARACVATDVPGCRDVVRHGENGWLTRPRDAEGLAATLLEALSSRDELRQRGLAGRAMAERELSKPAVVGQTLAVYRELLGRRWPAR